MINISENTLSFRRKDSAPLSSQDENSLQIEKVTDSKSSDSIKDFLINELKEIEEPENLDNTKKKISKTNNITFSLEDKDGKELENLSKPLNKNSPEQPLKSKDGYIIIENPDTGIKFEVVEVYEGSNGLNLSINLKISA